MALTTDLSPALEQLGLALEAKAEEFDGVVKSGRTHMMDATPVTLGQEFEGYAHQVANAVERAAHARDMLLELALGGTAVGTGMNRRPEFPRSAIKYINEDTGLAFYEAVDHFEAQGTKDGCVDASGQLKTIAVSLAKIANDIRLMASGPRTGIAEITLPSIQPGSSIMPGKVNPVVCESVHMVCAQVIGYDATITLGGLGSYLELNVMMPVIAYDLLEQIRLLANVSRVFRGEVHHGNHRQREARGGSPGAQSLVVHRTRAQDRLRQGGCAGQGSDGDGAHAARDRSGKKGAAGCRTG
jgi:fumarate hydratase class II